MPGEYLYNIIWWNTSYSGSSQSYCLQRQDKCQWGRKRLYLQFIIEEKLAAAQKMQDQERLSERRMVAYQVLCKPKRAGFL